MIDYKKVYCNYFGYDSSDWIACECGCGREAVDIHHIDPKSTHPRKRKCIENLVAVARVCHDKADRDRVFNEELREIHRRNCLKSKHDSGEIKRF